MVEDHPGTVGNTGNSEIVRMPAGFDPKHQSESAKCLALIQSITTRLINSYVDVAPFRNSDTTKGDVPY